MKLPASQNSETRIVTININVELRNTAIGFEGI
jgi:hypothetical protein